MCVRVTKESSEGWREEGSKQELEKKFYARNGKRVRVGRRRREREREKARDGGRAYGSEKEEGKRERVIKKRRQRSKQEIQKGFRVLGDPMWFLARPRCRS